MPPREKNRDDANNPDVDQTGAPPADNPAPVEVSAKDLGIDEIEMVPATTLRVSSFNVHRFVGFVDEVEYEVSDQGTDVPTDVADDLIAAALSVGVLVVREEGEGQ